MKILISEFRQESNSLSPSVSDLDFWLQNGWILRPKDVRDAHRGTGSAIDGMLSAIELLEPHAEVVFGPAFYAQSGGTAAQAVMDRYTEELARVLLEVEPVDALLFSFHGALQTSEFDDAEAEVLRRVREIVGETPVIGVSTDLHGYISSDFIARVDVVCGYQTYPHVDFEATGRRTVALTLQLLNSDAPTPVLAWAPIPMMVSASAYNTLEGDFAALIAEGHRRVAAGEIRDFTVYQMQPWLDVANPNSTVVVIADDQKTAIVHANELAGRLYEARHSFTTRLASIDDAIDMALDDDIAKPVIVVDSADSNNAGASGDSMAVADKLLRRTAMPRAATVVADSAAVDHAFHVGVGGTSDFRIGGTLDARAVSISTRGYVRSLHDGTFRTETVGHTGDTVRVGRTAIIQCESLDVVICEHIAGNGDPQLYRAFGIEPTMYDLIVVKANTSFRTGYRNIGGTIVPTDTPGAASANIAALPFQHVPRTMFPWTDAPFMPFATVVRRRPESARHPVHQRSHSPR